MGSTLEWLLVALLVAGATLYAAYALAPRAALVGLARRLRAAGAGRLAARLEQKAGCGCSELVCGGPQVPRNSTPPRR